MCGVAPSFPLEGKALERVSNAYNRRHSRGWRNCRYDLGRFGVVRMSVSGRDMDVIALEISAIFNDERREYAATAVGKAMKVLNPRFNKEKWAIACSLRGWDLDI